MWTDKGPPHCVPGTRRGAGAEGRFQLPQAGPWTAPGVPGRTSLPRGREDARVSGSSDGLRAHAAFLAWPGLAHKCAATEDPPWMPGGASLFKRKGGSGGSPCFSHSHASRCQPSRR